MTRRRPLVDVTGSACGPKAVLGKFHPVVHIQLSTFDRRYCHPAARAGRRPCLTCPWEAVDVPKAPIPKTVGATGSMPMAAFAVGVLVLVLLAAGCDTALDRPPTPESGTGSGAPTTATSVSITPVTPDGFLSGPGVTDQTITLGLLVDPERDRGFSTGVELWQQAVNTSGGLCGRSVELVTSGSSGVSADVVEAYDATARSTIGVIILPPVAEAAALNSRIAADQIPALTPTGTSTQLGPSRPIVIGPTQDILAINGLDYLAQADRLAAGSTVGVLTDGSPAAENALRGARWWATEHNVTLDVRAVGSEAGPADWGAATTVLALTGAAATAGLTTETDSDITVLTTLDGYDPALWDTAALDEAKAGRVLVSTGTPAFGSDYPAAVAVSSRAAAAGETDPGPRLFDGYATGANWSRLLTAACAERTLTRQAIENATTTVGPASVDSLYGPTPGFRPCRPPIRRRRPE
jgi:hypothetical protein